MPPSETASARDRLLDAAEHLMWQRGYEAVGIAELCSVAEAPRGSFYYWWPSKQALALSMIERSWAHLRSTLFEPSFRGAGSFAEQLDAYVDRLSRHLTNAQHANAQMAGCRFGNLTAELSTRDEEIRAALEAVFDEMHRIFATAIAGAMASGEVGTDIDPDDAAEGLCAHMEGLMILAKARNQPSVLERLRVDGRRLVGLPVAASPRRPVARRHRSRAVRTPDTQP